MKLYVTTLFLLFALDFIIILAAQKTTKYTAKNVRVIPEGDKKPLKKVDKDAVSPKSDGTPGRIGQVGANIGKANVPLKPAIVNGATAEKSQFPWQVAVISEATSFCGGSLISLSYILTAGHCTYGVSTFELIFGIVMLNESKRLTKYSSTSITHKSYDSANLRNDISVILLPEPITAEQMSRGTIGLIRLPSASDAKIEYYVNKNATASGWGLTNDKGHVSNILKYVTLTVISNAECAQTFGRKFVYSTTLCTYGMGMKSICQGDSGGPLQILESDGRYTQIGIVSFSSSNSCMKNPAGYTRTTSFLSWISKNTGVTIRP